VTEHHRFLIAHHLNLIEELERHIAAFDARIEKLLAPLRDAVALGSTRAQASGDQRAFEKGRLA
jgi:hypothetical protein